jgi:hypothetical protein
VLRCALGTIVPWLHVLALSYGYRMIPCLADSEPSRATVSTTVSASAPVCRSGACLTNHCGHNTRALQHFEKLQ